MLTPGEFVVNRKEVLEQNLGLLKSINSGSDVSYLAAGGQPDTFRRAKRTKKKTI